MFLGGDTHFYKLGVLSIFTVKHSCYFVYSGMNTSTSTIYSLLAILTAKPDVQEKAQEEVDRVLQGQRPKLKDKQKMPYIQALLEEVLRYVVITPGIPHKATRDAELSGHFIKKGTVVKQQSCRTLNIIL